MIITFRFQAATRSGNRLHDAVFVQGDDDHLAVVAAEPKGGLVAVIGLPPHLHAPNGAQPLELEVPLDEDAPLAVADAHSLGHSQSSSRGVFGLRRRRYHRSVPAIARALWPSPCPFRANILRRHPEVGKG